MQGNFALPYYHTTAYDCYMYLAIDIGGTKTRLAWASDGQTVSDPHITTTPQKFSDAIKLFEEVIPCLTDNQPIQGVAMGVAGPLNDEKSEVNPPNIPDWKGKPLKKELERITSSQVFIENDTAMVGLGEIAKGAAKEYKDKIVVYLTISTGVGGTRIVNNQIDVSALGFEPGHQFVNYDSPDTYCNCGQAGHLEGTISGTAFHKKHGRLPEEIKDPDIWEETAHILAYGLNNVTVFWSPHCIVLGGSMMKDIPLESTKKYLQQHTTIFPSLPEVKKAALDDLGGLHGSIAYLQNKGI